MRVTVALTAVATLASASLVQAQAPLVGTVRDSASGRPLEGVEIAIEAWSLTATTDAKGRFRLVLPGGTYPLEARRIGYRPEVRLLRVVVRDTVRLDLALAPAPQELPELTAAAELRERLRAPIEERVGRGIGSFLTEDLLRRSEHRQFSNLLQATAPGVFIEHIGTRAQALGRGNCPMAVWLDGIRIYAPNALGGSEPPPDLDRWEPTDFQTVEVYPGPSETPTQYQTTGSACGTILLWTRIR